jgi:hypothetical protein
MAPFSWKVAGMSTTGFSHKENGTPCQDAHAVATLPGGWLVGVVSDGAGSAARSADGARFLCDGVLAHLSLRLDEICPDTNEHISETLVRRCVEESVDLVRARLNILANKEDNSLADFHATLVGAVANSTGGIFFHIGDGAACATRSDDLTASVVSPPENGEYANETYFATQNEWRDHLRTTAFDSKHDLITLMSDGVMPFALARGATGPYPPFFEPLSRFLSDHDRDEGERALLELLERDVIQRITGDDKTLLWALRVEANGHLLHR